MRSWKPVPLRDVMWFVALASLATAAAIAAALTPQEWPWQKAAVISATVAAFWALVLLVYLHRRLTAPRFVIEDYDYAVAVWSEVKVDPALIGLALRVFTEVVARERAVENSFVAKSLNGAAIDIRRDPLSAAGAGWMVRDAEGLQRGKGIIIHWRGSVAQSALFHELLHLYDEWRRGKIDYQHADEVYWRIEARILEEWANRG